MMDINSLSWIPVVFTGMKKASMRMAKQSAQAIEEADVVLFLVDARDGVTVGDQAIADHLRNNDEKVYMVCNKIDGIDA